jgi:YHS domain-containing protein
MIEDIVCNKPLPAGTEMWMSRYHGRTFYFCSLACKERFELEPEDYFAVLRPRQLLPPAARAMR